ncbi:hypothetical protein MSG28_003856 [Choristoneura fumiferana]|uniref:Uncharacterized protein n=1 Tax=Choristoneura fumiferana TaxID=7141 RepID=A0ACC0KGU5_CHOFU|nr:hypothetical protein MSG28_003856 [Choristoneura fumiferana]
MTRTARFCRTNTRSQSVEFPHSMVPYESNEWKYANVKPRNLHCWHSGMGPPIDGGDTIPLPENSMMFDLLLISGGAHYNSSIISEEHSETVSDNTRQGNLQIIFNIALMVQNVLAMVSIIKFEVGASARARRSGPIVVYLMGFYHSSWLMLRHRFQTEDLIILFNVLFILVYCFVIYCIIKYLMHILTLSPVVMQVKEQFECNYLLYKASDAS